MSTLQPKLSYSTNLIAPDSRNGNGLTLLTLLVVKSAFHHGMPTIRLKTSNFEDRQLRKKRQLNIGFLVDFWGLRDPSIKTKLKQRFEILSLCL